MRLSRYRRIKSRLGFLLSGVLALCLDPLGLAGELQAEGDSVESLGSGRKLLAAGRVHEASSAPGASGSPEARVPEARVPEARVPEAPRGVDIAVRTARKVRPDDSVRSVTPPSAGAVVPEARSLERERSDPAIAQPARKRRHPRRNRGRWTPPWVAVQSLVPPSVEAAEIFKEEIPEEPQVPWHVFDGSAVGALRVDFENAPPYVKNGQRPLFYIEPREDSRYARAFQRVVRRKLFSELRSEAKRTWREVFASRPRMSFADFEKRLLQINRLGREKGEGSLFDQDYYTTALKEDLFAESYREGESDIPIVAWGPFVVTDTGSMRVDLGRLVEFEEFVTDPENVEIQPGESEKRPFLQSRDYRVHTNVRLHFDPLAPVDEADPTWLIKRYGVAVTVDWLSDVLGKEMLSAELEAEVDRDGDFGVAINFIIRSRD